LAEQPSEESVLSTAVRAHISHAVIAAYVADAIEAAGAGVVLAGAAGKAIRVTAAGDEAGTINLELKLIVEVDVAAPDAARAVDAAVRRDVDQLVGVPVGVLRIVFEGGT
jgi:hypothetical protein